MEQLFEGNSFAEEQVFSRVNSALCSVALCQAGIQTDRASAFP